MRGPDDGSTKGEESWRALDVEIVEEKRVRLLERLAASGGLAFLATALAAGLVTAPANALLFSMASLVTAATALLLPFVGMLTTSRILGAPIGLDAGYLYISRAHKIDLRTMGIAWLRGPRTVEVSDPNGIVRIHFESPTHAIALVRSLRRRGRDRGAYHMPTRSPSRRFMRAAMAWLGPAVAAWLAAMAGVAAGVPLAAASIAAPTAALISVLWLRRRRALFVGADGLVLVGLRRRFIAYRDVTNARTRWGFTGDEIVLRLANGKSVSLGALERDSAILIARLVEEGREMVQAGEAAGADVATLALDDQEDESSWRRRLERLSARAGSYREHALDADRLLSLMRNPATDDQQRVAAALALRADPGALSKIRVAASVSAEPSVNVLLTAVADATIDERKLRRVLRRRAR